MKLNVKMLADTIRIAHRGRMPQTVEISLSRGLFEKERLSYVKSFFKGKSLDINDYQFITTRVGTRMNYFEDIVVFEKK